MRKILIGLFVFILLVVLFLPKIASTPIGKPLLVKAIEEKSGAKVEVGSLSLSWLGPQKFQEIRWTRDKLNGNLEEFQIDAPFWSFTGPFLLKNGTLIYKGNRVEQIEGKIVGNDLDLHGSIVQGHISLKGKVESKHQFDIQIDVKNFPAIDFDDILGPSIDLKGSITRTKSQGSLDLNVSSANLKTHLIGLLTEDAFTITSPLLTTLRLTPQLSTLLLKDANPLFLTGIEAQNPITLRIEPKDFSFPLPFSIEKLKVGKATLDLGKVRCQNGKSLSSLILLLKASRLADAKQMNAWFTPVSFQINHGILDAGRMDILLADSIHLCTWGKINLLKDRLDMILGLPADTLLQSFGIKNLPENYVLKVDVRGTTKEPEIVTGPAGAKIAALIAAGQIPKKGVFGGLADIFTKPQEDENVPPAQRPFPWEK